MTAQSGGVINQEQKSKQLEIISLALSQIERQFGKGAIMRLGDQSKSFISSVETLPTGSLALDVALGVGGYPHGRIVEIFGPESSGKTTLCYHAIAETHKRGGIAAFIDAEHAFDVTYARKVGVNTDDLLITQPDTGEQALEIAEILVRSGAVNTIVIDSVAALVPRAEIEGDMGDATMGAQARLMSQALRKLTAAISKSNTLVIFTNQIRMKIGQLFGNPETTTGGNALKFYASIRLDIRRIGQIKQGMEILGNRTRVKVVKNKMAPPFKEVEFDILFGEGISREGSIVDLATQMSIIEKSGAWFSFKDQKLGQGRENVKQLLKEKPELAQEIEARVRTQFDINRNGQKSDELKFERKNVLSETIQEVVVVDEENSMAEEKKEPAKNMESKERRKKA